MIFGLHTVFDLKIKPGKHLNDGPFWRTLLVDTVALLQVRALSKPHIHASSCSNPKWEPENASGFSGCIVLAESHVYFHGFAESGYVFFDTFSCKEYDPVDVWTLLDDCLDIQDGHYTLIERGMNFPFK